MHRIKTNHRFKFWLFSLVSVLDGLVTVLTLGQLGVEWRSNLLFSEWMDEDEQ